MLPRKNRSTVFTGQKLYEEVKDHGHRHAHYIEDKDMIPEILRDELKEGDLVVFLGAGDVWRQGPKLLGILNNENK